MDMKLFSQFMWKSMFIFCPAYCNRGVSFPITHQVELSKKNIIEGKSELFEPYKTQLSSFLCFLFSFILKFNLYFCGVANYRVTGEYLVWNNATASLCRKNLVCPASDQVSISKSGFQIASPPLFFFSLFFFFFMF